MKSYKLLVGIDVAKLKLDVCLVTDVQSKQHQYMQVSNDAKGIQKLLREVARQGFTLQEALFCFENTGIYSMPLAYYLNSKKADYWVIPAIEIKRSKGISRGKSDKVDSKDIAFYAHSHGYKLQLHELPEADILRLKLLQTQREKLLKAIVLLKSTDENDGFLPKELLKEINKTNRQALTGLKKALAETEAQIATLVKQNETIRKQYQLVKSVPGVGPQTAIYLIVVTKCFTAFSNWRKLACYSGVAPFEYTSGSSIRGRTRVHHLADKKLKSLLNMCALSAKKSDKELSAYYLRKTKEEGKNAMLVMNSIRCKVLSRAFATVTRGTPFVNTLKYAA